MHVAICIATFKRPRLLQKLLRGLAQLRFVKVATPEIAVIVVDNDTSGTASEICYSTILPWHMKYLIEPKRGIAEARNCALRQIGDADFVAFIDDDEVPNETWLDELLAAQAKFHADTVTGPVYPFFTSDVPEWIRKEDFFDRATHSSGKTLPTCATNNTLVVRNVIDHIGSFDDRFQLIGVDDWHFFTRVRLAGFKIVWCEEAVVRETISSDRANLGWILRRAYRGGNSYAVLECSLDDRLSLRLARFFKGSARILQGSLRAAASLLMGRGTFVRAMRNICSGAGMITGVAGLRYQAYKTVTGDPKPGVNPSPV